MTEMGALQPSNCDRIVSTQIGGACHSVSWYAGVLEPHLE